MSRACRPTHPCLLIALVVSLALFFGLFFGLNYPEIIRNGWPLSTCTILDAKLLTRYCCETSCETSSCSNAPSGSPQCGPLISQLDSGYSPSACSANSSACPPGIGSTCDGGYHCCRRCCYSCPRCTTSCSRKKCSTHCTQQPCNCYCCSSSDHISCTLSCPTCYRVDLTLSYKTRQGILVDGVPYSKDFKKNNNSAVTFFNQHQPQSTAYCHYNPRNLQQVLFDVHFTPWKWAISAVFGMLPLAFVLSFYAIAFAIIPIIGWIRDTLQDSRGRYGSLGKLLGSRSIGDESGPSWDDDRLEGEKKLVQAEDEHDGSTLAGDDDENEASLSADDTVHDANAKAKES